MYRTINHDTLGDITEKYSGCWITTEIELKEFGYKTFFEINTEGDIPSKENLDQICDIILNEKLYHTKVEKELFQQYIEYERPSYLEILDDERFTPILRIKDLPNIKQVSEIWSIITGMYEIVIYPDEPDLTFGFKTTFDNEHTFAVRYSNGKLYECMMD